MYLDRDDYRGILVFLAIISAILAITFYVRSLDLPAGSYFHRGYRIWEPQVGIQRLRSYIPVALGASFAFGLAAHIIGRKKL